jgi:hypothetical protein
MEWILAGFLVVHIPNEVGATRSPATVVGIGPSVLSWLELMVMPAVVMWHRLVVIKCEYQCNIVRVSIFVMVVRKIQAMKH